MSEVSIRDLRHRGGDIVDRAERGEAVIITRNGRPVAELRPLPRRPLSSTEFVERARGLPPVDAAALRADLDELFDFSL